MPSLQSTRHNANDSRRAPLLFQAFGKGVDILILARTVEVPMFIKKIVGELLFLIPGRYGNEYVCHW
ncbi:hypothetical protein AYO43_09115 [Nitrospira sp. SCGC AG-212-E16]|nr:hypothetical protein AYO43_09115 [Nitrospira sp. SCGC AG-212-E16]